MPTIWDELRRLIGDAEQCLRDEEEKYLTLKARQRDLVAYCADLSAAATAVIRQPCAPYCGCPNCKLIAIIALEGKP